MLILPTNGLSYFTIVGIDPGSVMLGVAILNIDIRTLDILSTEAFTLNGNKLANHDSWLCETYGERLTRINALENKLVSIFLHYQPLSIAVEAPFFNMRRPQAFQALTEVICAIRTAINRYDIWKVMETIDPATVKKSIGNMGNADKDTMKKKMLSLMNINYNGCIPIDQLDEHSIDAIAVCIWKYKDLIKNIVNKS